MGRVLQIRVSASTFDPDQVPRRWPELFKLGYGESPPDASRGVLELTATLADRKRLGMLPGDTEPLFGDLDRAEALRERLEAALADWKPAEANELSERLEELLDEVEKRAEKR